MAEVITKIRKWGNSFGIVIPQKFVNEEGLKEGEEVRAIVVKEGNVLRETFGKHKFKKSVKKLMSETDKELYNE